MNPDDAANLQQSYPSPNAVAADNGGPFYSSQNQPTANMTSPEELQLAAQLSRNMAPNMTSDNGIDSLPTSDLRAQQGVVNHQYQQDPQNHSMHDHQQQQQQQQLAAHHQHVGNAQLDGMGGQYGSPVPADSSAGANRKRSKVSRACDECRRKKVRCDASEDPGEGAPCTNCKRLGAECLFSRVPMKRGPSKGYIKELADRLHNLENTMGQSGEITQAPAQHEIPYQHRPSEEFSPAPGMEQGRKRSFSSISNDFGTPFQTNQRSGPSWSQDSGRQNHPSTSTFTSNQLASGGPQLFRDPNYSPNDIQQPSWRNAPDTLNRQGNSFNSQGDQAQGDHVVTDPQALIQEYYNTVHLTFPILSQSDEPLAKITPATQDSFFNALHNAVRSLPSEQPFTSLPINAASFDHSSRSAKIVHLQVILLELIEATSLDPAYKPRQPSTSPSMLLGTAVGLAYSLKLHVHKTSDRVSEGETGVDEQSERRLWWCVVVMDKWHAASTSSPVMIPDDSCIFYSEDRAVLGDPLYHLARLSLVLAQMSEILTLPNDESEMSVKEVSKYGTLLRGQLKRVQEDFPETFFPASNCPLIHICYWGLRILMELIRPDSEPKDLLEPALHIITQLNFNTGFISPLTYHATTLAVLALVELMGIESTKAEATVSLKSFLENRHAQSSWDGVINTYIVKKLPPVPNSTAGPSSALSEASLTASQGLQRLADLATATEEGKQDNEKIAPTSPFERYHEMRGIIRRGYVSAFTNLATSK
ncbi:hypothetical protein PVAG01_06135 [Phlyctema vagabunda]|uniref:Zn(2)-C6 fungal-type domain-containing protein n=1 Tax=Phlyctema vagabunda TaxID=108571 RepID=A0ABR4PFC0_9HELO